jgi:transcriptional regulator with XRE-family HTH domain
LGTLNKRSTRTLEFDLLLVAIREARERSGLSQREVSRRVGMGVDESWLGKVERGQRTIDVVEFIAVAKACNTDPLELLGNVMVLIQKSRLNEP